MSQNFNTPCALCPNKSPLIIALHPPEISTGFEVQTIPGVVGTSVAPSKLVGFMLNTLISNVVVVLGIKKSILTCSIACVSATLTCSIAFLLATLKFSIDSAMLTSITLKRKSSWIFQEWCQLLSAHQPQRYNASASSHVTMCMHSWPASFSRPHLNLTCTLNFDVLLVISLRDPRNLVTENHHPQTKEQESLHCKTKFAQLPAIDMQKLPGSFCCYSNLSPRVIQPGFDSQSLLAEACCMSTAGTIRSCACTACQKVVSDEENRLKFCRYWLRSDLGKFSSLDCMSLHAHVNFHVIHGVTVVCCVCYWLCSMCGRCASAANPFSSLRSTCPSLLRSCSDPLISESSSASSVISLRLSQASRSHSLPVEEPVVILSLCLSLLTFAFHADSSNLVFSSESCVVDTFVFLFLFFIVFLVFLFVLFSLKFIFSFVENLHNLLRCTEGGQIWCVTRGLSKLWLYLPSDFVISVLSSESQMVLGTSQLTATSNTVVERKTYSLVSLRKTARMVSFFLNPQ
ncbi:hypothetical protein VP01_4122g1 [Puccinia sorghi]|uniref:Uncharacterized protein n=1 Tax=Puccinia sorghi TaxID=27349 RepID=A0A0L6UR81_9BASI|nr:hypothetical protein VP01_4122g1 [Puccinia sorghi]